jgi:two-component system, LytTR family, response regulator
MPEAEPPGIRTLVVDDEPVARRTLRRLLEPDPEIELVGEAAGSAAPGLILETRPDLLFLDVQMPGMNGFEVLEAVAERHIPLVVFVTAYDAYAVRAFELRAVDYLLKPFTDARFGEALARAKQTIRAAETGRVFHRIREVVAGHRARLALKAEGRTTLLDVGAIDWIEAVGSSVRIHAGPSRSMLRTTLAELEASLDPARFFRIHRSAIVNLDRVKHFEHWSHGDYLVVLANGTELRLSRSRKPALEELLGSTL